MNYNIIDKLFNISNKPFIILISSLDTFKLNTICIDIEKDLNFQYLSFIHFDIDDKYDENFKKVFERLDELIKDKPDIKGFIISAKLLPLNFTVDLHINLAINKTLFDSIKIDNKYNDNILTNYVDNNVDKFINVKINSNLNKLADYIYFIIIDAIEHTVYGNDYKKHACKEFIKYKEF